MPNDKSNSALLVFNSLFVVPLFFFSCVCVFCCCQGADRESVCVVGRGGGGKGKQRTSKTLAILTIDIALCRYLVPLYVNFSAFTIFFVSAICLSDVGLSLVFMSFFLWLLPLHTKKPNICVCVCYDGECFQAIIIIIMGFVAVLLSAVTVVANHVSVLFFYSLSIPGEKKRTNFVLLLPFLTRTLTLAHRFLLSVLFCFHACLL